jgi:acetyl-CoA carboxylase biotin carboxyl carrier protein
MVQNESDLQKIKELIEIMKDNDLIEVELKHGADKISLKRFYPQQSFVTAMPVVAGGARVESAADAAQNLAAKAASVAPQQQNLVEIKSLIVGTLYTAPSPDSEPFVDVGSHIDSQTVVCVIEAMKVMNEIKAETGGTIAEVLVKNGQAVEYGQVLFRVRPD